jgi:hypothetical protein
MILWRFVTMIDRLYWYVGHFPLSEVYLTYLILWKLPLFLPLGDYHCTNTVCVIFLSRVSDMSWDETLALPVYYTLHPTVKDQVVTSRRKISVELSQQQQATFRLEWHSTKFITEQGMDLEPSQGFGPLHWFVLHSQTLLHTSPVQKSQQF